MNIIKIITTALEKLSNKQNSLATDVTNEKYPTVTAVNTHVNNTSNPHSVTKTQVGLGNVDNTSDVNKPISTATQTALNNKVTSVVAGANVTVDNTDPLNPIVSSTGGGGGGSLVIGTSPITGGIDGGILLKDTGVLAQHPNFTLLAGILNFKMLNSSQNVHWGLELSNGSGKFLRGYGDGSVNNTGRQLVESNVMFGKGAGNNATGGFNCFFGNSAGASTTTGVGNLFIGNESGFSNISGSNNIFFGSNAGVLTTNGSNNAFIGQNCGRENASGGNNSFVGYRAGYSKATGDGNVFFGYETGRYLSGGTNLTSATNSTFLGSEIRSFANAQTNEIIIGYNAIGEGSNTARVGNTSIDKLYIGGNGAGIAVKTPDGTKTYKISVDNSGNIISTLI